MKKLFFLSLLIGAILIENGAHALTPIKIVNMTGREYVHMYIYAGEPSASSVIYSQTLSKEQTSSSTSIYSTSGNFKGLKITVTPGPGFLGPKCSISHYPDVTIPIITITSPTTCTITTPSQAGMT